jgi:hypothetical protein
MALEIRIDSSSSLENFNIRFHVTVILMYPNSTCLFINNVKFIRKICIDPVLNFLVAMLVKGSFH